MPAGGGGAGGGGGGCGGGGGGFSSFSIAYSTRCSRSYRSYAGRSVARSHNNTTSNQSRPSGHNGQNAGKSRNKDRTTYKSSARASVDQPKARETDQTNSQKNTKKQRSLNEMIYQCVEFCLLFTCGCCCVTVCIVAPIALIVSSDVLIFSSTDIATNFFSPGDSRLIQFSSFFCEGVDVKVDSAATGATLFLVDTPPPLSDANNFTIADSRTLGEHKFQFWQYYLYLDSNISVSICIDKKFRLDIYIIKGNSNANYWARSPGRKHAKLFQRVTKKCPQQHSFSYTVQEEDQYYIIFHNSLSKEMVSYNLELSIQRFEYSIESDNYSEICYAPSGAQCSVDIPYDTGSQLALVVTSIPLDVDWEENVDVVTSCRRRHWAYAVVILTTILAFTAIVVLFLHLLLLWCL